MGNLVTPPAPLEAGSPRPQPPLQSGDPAPWFRARSDAGPDFKFSSMGGRIIVLAFLASFTKDRAASDGLRHGGARFGAFRTALLLVSADPADADAALPPASRGMRYLFDGDGQIAALFGVTRTAGGPTSFILDERLRIVAQITTPDAARHAAVVYTRFDRLAPLADAAPAAPQAPVLVAPRIFEPELCKMLIDGHVAHGGADSGFMVERDGMTVVQVDHTRKRRSDWNIEDQRLIDACQRRIQRRLVPEIVRAFQFEATRIERHTVARYDAETRGHFGRHRDNTTKGTAHRKFAVSINLNAEEYEGGDLVFPEFGAARFRPPTGGACVFSCSLLHEATPVTKGTRYVFVPFLYDDAGAALREKNRQFLSL